MIGLRNNTTSWKVGLMNKIDRILMMTVASVMLVINTKSIACSSECVDLESIEASAPIKGMSGYTYSEDNLVDDDYQTAWCTKDDKATVFFNFNGHRNFNGIGLINGYAKNDKVFSGNKRVREIVLLDGENKISTIEIKDSQELQWFSFPEVRTRRFGLKATKTIQGERYADLCLTEILWEKDEYEVNQILSSIDDVRDGQALDVKELKSRYNRLLTEFYPGKSFWKAMALRISKGDRNAIRILLDVRYFLMNFVNPINAENLEALRDMLIPFVANNSDDILAVYEDESQVMRDAIVSAFVMYIDPLDAKQIQELYTRSPSLKKLSVLIESKE